MAKDVLLEDLNQQQKEAILHLNGPLLVLAGAGSGKTKLISHKYAYLVKKKKHKPSKILTFTYSNRAAHQMREKISTFLGTDIKDAWIGTFYSQCTKILRKEHKLLGLKPDFAIYDEEDQCFLVRHILRDLNIYEALFKGVTSRISMLKSSLVSPEQFLSAGDGFSFDEKLGRVYIRYQNELKRCNALDFDDLVVLTIRLFQDNPQTLDKYSDQFPYVLVDEFQDTSRAQYQLIKHFTSRHKNICAVGDDDQTIFKCKGGNVSHVFNFEKDFPGAKVIRLEQAYRQTQHILEVSRAVIRKNPDRKPKSLWTERTCGEKVFYCRLDTEEDEAKYVARTIKDLYLKGYYEYSSFAVFYRISLQTRAIEDALREEGIPCQTIGGVSFYHRREIKELLAYVRLCLNHTDNVSLCRILSSPPWNISSTILSKIEDEAKKHSLCLFMAVKSLLKSNGLASPLKDRLAEFIKVIEALSTHTYKNAAEFLKIIVDKTGYIEDIESDRLQNVLELISCAENIQVREFIDKVSLVSSFDVMPKNEAVSLLTLRNAKGLEFPVVFIVGLEEGIMPYFKAIEDTGEMQEERRLFYVGMTRASDMLCLTGARKRKLYSKIQQQELSRFLLEIPKKCCNWIERSLENQDNEAIITKTSHKRVKPLFLVGTRVKHPSWGVGVIKDCCGEGDETKLTINFSSIGLKRLIVKFANLERI